MRATMFRPGLALAALLSLAGAARAADAPAKCQIGLIGEMKLDFAHDRPILDATVNGRPVHALADTGASLSLMDSRAAREMGLPMDDVAGLRLYGVGGNARAQMALVKELKVGTVVAHSLHMIAAGEGRSGAELVLGQDFWGQADAEFDLAHGAIRFLKPARSCSEGELVYWAKAGQAYSLVPMAPGDDSRRHVIVTVKLNGRPVRALIDSGAQRSVAVLSVADRIGLADRTAEGHGVGVGGTVVSYVGRLDSFTIGDETINGTRLRFSDLFGKVGFSELGSRIARGAEDAPEMLLGADFLRSHHVLMSQSRHAVYFTYEGGPVFDTRPPPPAPPPQTPAEPSPAVGPGAP